MEREGVCSQKTLSDQPGGLVGVESDGPSWIKLQTFSDNDLTYMARYSGRKLTDTTATRGAAPEVKFFEKLSKEGFTAILQRNLSSISRTLSSKKQ